jgi:D-alanyl-D-alanine endopeptidase (penicillin-binding protein 7)
MVFLDSTGKLSRIADAERVRHWVESSPVLSRKSAPLASLAAEQRIASN